MRARSIAAWTLAAIAFAGAATLNVGVYRYAVGDQAFYIPAILRHLNPDLYPRDRVLIDDQDRLTVTNRAAAAIVRTTGASLPAVFAAVYAAALGLVFLGAMLIGRSLGLTRWAQAALAAALALRHRVGMTAVNTLEGYGHPRMLAWGIGLVAVGMVLRGRSLLAIALTGLAVAVHPTTGIWFVIWIGVTIIVCDRRLRLPLLVAAGAAAAAAAWALLAGPLASQMVRMDPEWLSVLSGKGYLFPTAWPLSAWAMSAMYVAVGFGVFLLRRRLGLATPRESAMIAGALALVLLFVVTLPAVHARLAIAIQFQITRVFWILDFLAVLYAVWLAVDCRSRKAVVTSPVWSGRALATVLIIVIALGRGAYVSWVEHAGEPIVRIGPGTGEWENVMAWVARTPSGTHVLLDPGHSYRYGTSARVSGERDTFLEEVKDSAMAMYSRRVALRVLERTRMLGDFQELTPARAREVASRFEVDYLITERPMDLPVAYQNARFRVYRLREN